MLNCEVPDALGTAHGGENPVHGLFWVHGVSGRVGWVRRELSKECVSFEGVKSGVRAAAVGL